MAVAAPPKTLPQLMTFPTEQTDPVLALAQYPILRTRIRERMRRELFNRGVISPQEFEADVRSHAISSQARERLANPLSEEPTEVWEDRLQRVRNHLTDFYFANNLPFELFEQIVRKALMERGAESGEILVSFNPELAPQSMLFEHAFALENLPAEERGRFEARLREIKVVLIRTMISDQLAYVSIAKDWFTAADLHDIRQRKIGYGKIGGKAAGLLLAARILKEVAGNELLARLRIPESYYLGADLFYTFMSYNGLMHWNYQKYKPEEQIRAEYSQIQEEYAAGNFPADVLDKLVDLLEIFGPQPIIVRSSSLLEDNFGTSFAGKYDSYFCPNQGTPEENLQALTHAIKRVYASSLNPDALLYRRGRGLQDYDERMAVLIQGVQGERHGRYMLPQVSGVAFSRNLYRWSPQIRREDGFLRLVWGLGTRAVDRVGNDYPRLVALSHPKLRPEASPQEIRKYSQHYVDVIDLQENICKTLPIHEVLDRRYPVARLLAQVYHDGYLSPIRFTMQGDLLNHLVLTFEELLNRTAFAENMREILHLLENHYRMPVDMEFALQVKNPRDPHPDVEITLLQCRPQSQLQDSHVRLPPDLEQKDIIFSTHRNVPHGHLKDIRYVIFVTPEGYFSLPDPAKRGELSRAIGRLNGELSNERFLCVGPGRWGTVNPDLGVRVGYGDIYNAQALVELSGAGVGSAPELSFGTHFFQDLIEAQIYPLAIYLDDETAILNRKIFYKTPNRLLDYLPDGAQLMDCLRLIAVEDYAPGSHLELVMDDDAGQAVAFIAQDG